MASIANTITTPSARPRLLFYCQHSLGMGHLIRSFALVRSLTHNYEVIFLNGGPVPQDLVPPNDCEMVHLPPLGMDEHGKLICRDNRLSVQQAQMLRREKILSVYAEYKPQVVVIELFPFGRKKFADELLALLQRTREGERPLVLCSLRDILVNSRPDQAQHDDRASTILNEYFDAVLVHADPAFVRLEESFQPSRPVSVPIIYTGFVAPALRALSKVARTRRVVVSAGGGIVGGPLLTAAIQAQATLWKEEELAMTVIAGPFLPEAEWQRLCALAEGCPGLTLLRSVTDMRGILAEAAVSVSQCGYNTTMDILCSGVAALVVPYVTTSENEQMRRAQRLAELGAVQLLLPEQLSHQRLTTEVRRLLAEARTSIRFDMAGAERTAELIAMWRSQQTVTKHRVKTAGESHERLAR